MIKNLVLSGGGLNIYLSLGALDVLHSQGHLDNLENICGCSAGSMLAVCLALGITPRQISDIPQTDNLIKFNESKDVLTLGSPLDVTPVRDICQDFLNNYPDINTFQDLTDYYGKNVTIVATDYSTGLPVYFNTENTPDYDLVECMVASCTLPFVFAPTEYKGVKYWDGTIADPLSVTLYPPKESIAVNLRCNLENDVNPFMRFVQIMLERMRKLNSYEKYGIVELIVPEGRPDTMLKSNRNIKFKLFINGQNQTLKQISTIIKSLES